MKTGVYYITNLLNGKMIVGSGILKDRKKDHFSKLRHNKHKNPYLQKSFNKNGEENFVWGIIEYCEHDKCIENETFWVRFLNTQDPNKGYNINDPTTFRLGLKNSEKNRKGISERMQGNKINLGRKRSEEECQSLKNAYTLERKEKLKNLRLGKKYSEETCRNISKGLMGKKKSEEGKKNLSLYMQNLPDEHRKNMSLAAKKRWAKKKENITLTPQQF